jgi:hypothetical protein
VEEESYREISNPLDRAVRWDFHRLMKKWQIDLYRYDVRLTYDIVIPEPGSYLLRKYIQLKLLNDELAKPNPFNLSPTNITPDNCDALTEMYGASLEPAPKDPFPTSAHGEQAYSKAQPYGHSTLEIILPEGYEFASWDVEAETVYDWKDGKKYPVFYIYAYEQENSNRGMVIPIVIQSRDYLNGQDICDRSSSFLRKRMICCRRRWSPLLRGGQGQLSPSDSHLPGSGE